MFGVSPVRELVKVPVPVPSKVLVERAMVGLALVLQQTPRAMMADPPSDEMVPPELTAVAEITVAAVVESAATVLLD